MPVVSSQPGPAVLGVRVREERPAAEPIQLGKEPVFARLLSGQTLPGVVVRTVTVARPEALVVKPALLTGVAPESTSVPLAPVVSTDEQAALEQALMV